MSKKLFTTNIYIHLCTIKSIILHQSWTLLFPGIHLQSCVIPILQLTHIRSLVYTISINIHLNLTYTVCSSFIVRLVHLNVHQNYLQNLNIFHIFWHVTYNTSWELVGARNGCGWTLFQMEGGEWSCQRSGADPHYNVIWVLWGRILYSGDSVIFFHSEIVES